MKKRTLLVLVLVALAMLATGVLVPVMAASRRPRRITGAVKYTMTLYEGSVAPAWATFYVTEINRATGEASGRYTWWTIPETTMVRVTLTMDVDCVKFNGKGVAEFSGKNIFFEGWPEPLQACVPDVKIWVRDRRGRDEVGFYVNAADPEIDPCSGAPGFKCDLFCAPESCGPSALVKLAVEEGDLRVRR